jgi:hypothetical protein
LHCNVCLYRGNVVLLVSFSQTRHEKQHTRSFVKFSVIYWGLRCTLLSIICAIERSRKSSKLQHENLCEYGVWYDYRVIVSQCSRPNPLSSPSPPINKMAILLRSNFDLRLSVFSTRVHMVSTNHPPPKISLNQDTHLIISFFSHFFSSSSNFFGKFWKWHRRLHVRIRLLFVMVSW